MSQVREITALFLWPVFKVENLFLHSMQDVYISKRQFQNKMSHFKTVKPHMQSFCHLYHALEHEDPFVFMWMGTVLYTVLILFIGLSFFICIPNQLYLLKLKEKIPLEVMGLFRGRCWACFFQWSMKISLGQSAIKSPSLTTKSCLGILSWIVDHRTSSEPPGNGEVSQVVFLFWVVGRHALLWPFSLKRTGRPSEEPFWVDQEKLFSKWPFRLP